MLSLSKKEEKEIIQAIARAEKDTSGEIRVHIEAKCKTSDPVERAQSLFQVLKMTNTKDRNAVLFYIATEDRKFAIWGDDGINHVVPQGFWDDIKHTMLSFLSEGETTKALLIGVEMAGKSLKTFFPYRSNDKNELTDSISTS